MDTRHANQDLHDVWELQGLLAADKEGHQDAEHESKLKKYAKLILPHVGLIILSCVYVVTGAAVFYKLESPNEHRVRTQSLRTINSSRNQLLTHLWSLSQNVSEDHWKNFAYGDIDEMTRTLFVAFDTNYVTAKHLNTSATRGLETWTFSAAVFFTSTLLTTIGYGNVVPVTTEGRVFCICYGLFGVPLILITVADIGKFLSEHIVWCYCRYRDLRGRLKERHIRKTSSVQRHQTEEQRRMEQLRLELEKFGLEDYVSIPVSLVLVILVGYIALGAVLLGSIEHWDFFTAFYFSFITMTTVGFGDIVPVNQNYFLLDLLYIVIGLAITTMCIDLVGIQYIRKIHYFGRAIQDARYALVNVGGRMVHVSDLMKYASVLHKKYGIEGRAELLEALKDPAFVPSEIRAIRYIDAYRSSSSLHSAISSSFSRSRKSSYAPVQL